MPTKAQATAEEKAAAVARVRLGESVSAVSRSIGVSRSTIAHWIERAEAAETDIEKKLSLDAEELSNEIQHLTRAARHELIVGLREVIPKAIARGSLQGIATSYGILTDKDLKFREAEAKAQTKGEGEAMKELSDDDLDRQFAELLEQAGEGAGDPSTAGEGAPALRD